MVGARSVRGAYTNQKYVPVRGLNRFAMSWYFYQVIHVCTQYSAGDLARA